MLQYDIKFGLVLDVVNNMQQTLEQPSALYADMAEYIVASTQERFRTSTAPDGTKWQANAESTYVNILGDQHSNKDGTLNNKGVNRVMSKRPLLGDGTLMRDIHYQVSGDLLLVGSNLIYAATHQFGATIKAKNAKSLSWKIGNAYVFVKQVVIPQREYLGISIADEKELYAIIDNHLLS